MSFDLIIKHINMVLKSTCTMQIFNEDYFSKLWKTATTSASVHTGVAGSLWLGGPDFKTV